MPRVGSRGTDGSRPVAFGDGWPFVGRNAELDAVPADLTGPAELVGVFLA